MLDVQTAHSALNRKVYGLLGVPVDAETLQSVQEIIRTAVLRRTRFLISTVNLNFVMLSRLDQGFRKSLLSSDLCTIDGMPVVWIARALRIPVSERVAGSDIFDALVHSPVLSRKLNIILFGGPGGVAAKAAANINAGSRHAICVAAISPGFGNLDQISTPALVEEINAANADLLSVSLGAEKGQAWLLRNDSALSVPIRVHLGATINFHAGTVARAPLALRKLGGEWLWRIKEEPRLLKRYLRDGCIFLYLMVTKILPFALKLRSSERLYGTSTLKVQADEQEGAVKLTFSGLAWDRNIAPILGTIEAAVTRGKSVVFDLANVTRR